MGRPSALLIMGGADYHNTVAHYELLAGLLAGPAGCNVTVTDDFPAQTEESLSRYDLLVLWATYGAPPREPVDALFRAVRRGTPLLGIHTAPYTVREIDGGPEAIGSSYIKRFPHLPYQEITVNILDHRHPVTAGVAGLRHRGRAVLPGGPGAGRDAAGQLRRPRRGEAVTLRPGQAPDPRHEQAPAWRREQPRAPLVYVKPLGASTVCVNALGHDASAIANPGFRQLTTQAARSLAGAGPA